jgi:hypothetical protein
VLNTPDLNANRDLSLNGNTVGGDIRIVSTGSGRWQLVGGASGTVTILGDVIMEGGQFATQGTGSATDVVVDHYGDVVVTGGNFSISRGSQGNGAGTTRWVLHEGDLSLTGATTQNSNPTGATFVFAADGEQELALDNVTYAGGGLPITVAAGATLSITGDPIGGNGAFVVEDEGTLATAHPTGIDGVIGTSGAVTFAPLAGVRFAGTEAQVFGSLMPDSLGVLTIANPVGVVVSDTTHTRTLIVEAGARLAIEETGSLSVEDGGSVAGLIENEGELAATSAIDFGEGAVYDHARNGGSVPSGIWGEGSTVRFTGITSQAPGNRNQSFHHIIFDTPDQAGNLNMGFNDVIIGGDIRVISSGSGRWYLTSASAEGSAQVTILGDVIVEGGEFSVHGTGNALTTFTVDHYGDIVVTGGNFSIARGSQGSGSGSTTWTLHEGDFQMSGARTQNSNRGNAMFVFAADGVQHLVLGEGNQVDHLPILVESGTTLDVGESVIAGSDLFTLEAGAYLATAHVEGVAGSLQTTGDVTLAEGASFIFNGSEQQITSTMMPVVVEDLVINNPGGVFLSQETTIEGVLRLQAGVFDNATNFFILGENGSISLEGGSLASPVSAEDGVDAVTEFQLHQNYPNPVNGATSIRYDVSESVPVSIRVYDLTGRQVGVLVDAVHSPGRYTVEWDASDLASGVYVYRISAGEYSAVKRLTLVR